MGDENLLHRVRVDRGIALDQIAAPTSLNPIIVHAIDAGQFDALPAGIYARSYVRAFASAVGLEPEQAVRDLQPLLPGVGDPLPVLREIARGVSPDWPETLSGWINDLGGRIGACSTDSRDWWRRLVRRLGRTPWRPARRWVAACFDAAVLLLLLGLVVQLTAWTSTARIGEVLAAAGEQIAAVWGVLVIWYFVILGGVGGRTPGAVVCGVPASAAAEPLRLRSILERAMLQ